MNIADIVVIVVILLFAFLGYRRGLLMGIYSIGAYFIAIFIGFLLRKPVVAFIYKTPLPDKVYNNVYARLVEHNVSKGQEALANTEDYIESLKLPSLIENFLKKNIQTGEGAFEALAESISDKVTAFIVSVFAFLITFILVLIIMLVLKRIIKFARELPVIKQVDSVGGVLLGVLEGILIVSVVLLFIYMFSSRESLAPLVQKIEESAIAKLFFEKNFLANIISKLKIFAARIV
ncbi:MAG: CvpA family protein [Clostridia bacterium]|jgi:uncharacterized membrane protein required for colicin V production